MPPQLKLSSSEYRSDEKSQQLLFSRAPDFSLLEFSAKCVVLSPNLDDPFPLLPDVRLDSASLRRTVDRVLERLRELTACVAFFTLKIPRITFLQ